ncbi:MAG: hypothetical protein ACTHNU_12470 [Gaiellales bacterium]
MHHITAPRAAAAAAGLALLATWASPAVGFYLTLVACAGVMGASLDLYLHAVDGPPRARVVELAACGVAGLLLVVDASIRFPELLAPSAPPTAVRLAQVALGLTLAAVITPAATAAFHTLASGPRRRKARHTAGRISARSAHAIRRIADVK